MRESLDENESLRTDRPADARGDQPPTLVPSSGTPGIPAPVPPELMRVAAMTPEGPQWGPDTQLISLLGKGEYGTVYLVEHLAKLEAHKVVTRSADGKIDLFRDALRTRRIEHPNIVKIYGTERLGDQAVLRMEYVEGCDLRRLVDEQGALAAERAVTLTLQIADALVAAHEEGVTHRGIEPRNLILRKDREEVVIIDFGVSAAARSEGMSSPTVDVCALGATLRELVTGLPRGAAEQAERPPYVEEELWTLIERLQSAVPDGDLAEMAAARAALEEHWSTFECPACGNRVRFDESEEKCPVSECGSAEAGLRRTALLARRTADALVADCKFEDAVTALRRVAVSAPGARKELELRIELTESLDRDHGKTVDKARNLLKQWRHTECARLLDEARGRFSRSNMLQERRIHLRQRLEVQYRTAEEKVRKALLQLDFPTAQRVLDEVREILADDSARRELAAALGQEPAPVDWLTREVEKKESAYGGYLQRANEAIQAFDFRGAIQACTQLETHFPSQENIHMLRQLKQAEDLFGLATAYEEELLQGLIDAPENAPEGVELRLAGASRACVRLLEDFDAETYPSFERIARRQELLGRAAAAVRDFVGHNLAEADRARDERRIFDELRWLRASRVHVTGTDLFDSDEREHVESRRLAIESQVARAEELYSQGVEMLERRAYTQARLALMELSSISPDGFRDTEELLEKVEEAQQRFASLASRVERSLAEIDGARFSAGSAVEALELAEELYGFSDDEERSKQVALLGTAAVRIFGAYRAQGRPVTEAAPVVAALPEERWRAIAHGTPELARTICELAAQFPSPACGYEPSVAQVREILAGLEPIATLLRGSEPPSGCLHPCIALADRLIAALENQPATELERHQEEALALLEAIGRLAPGGLDAELQARRAELRRAGGRARVATFLRRAGHMSFFVLPAICAFGLGLLVGGDHDIEQELLPTSGSGPRSTELVEMDLPNLPEPVDARSWLSAASSPADTRRRIALIEGWIALRRANLEEANSPSRKIRTAASLSMLTSMAASTAIRDQKHRTLLVVLTADVSQGVDFLIRKELAEAEEELRVHPTDRRAVAGMLDETLLALQRSLEDGGFGQNAGELAELRAALSGFDARRAATAGTVSDAIRRIDMIAKARGGRIAADLVGYLSARLRGEVVAGLDELVLSSPGGGAADFAERSWELLGVLSALPPSRPLSETTATEREQLTRRAANLVVPGRP